MLGSIVVFKGLEDEIYSGEDEIFWKEKLGYVGFDNLYWFLFWEKMGIYGGD